MADETDEEATLETRTECELAKEMKTMRPNWNRRDELKKNGTVTTNTFRQSGYGNTEAMVTWQTKQMKKQR